jgi:hypothetical protein
MGQHLEIGPRSSDILTVDLYLLILKFALDHRLSEDTNVPQQTQKPTLRIQALSVSNHPNLGYSR